MTGFKLLEVIAIPMELQHTEFVFETCPSDIERKSTILLIL